MSNTPDFDTDAGYKARMEHWRAHAEKAEAEVEMLRGVGCNEDGDGPCGVCIKCLRARAEKAEAELAYVSTRITELCGATSRAVLALGARAETAEAEIARLQIKNDVLHKTLKSTAEHYDKQRVRSEAAEKALRIEQNTALRYLRDSRYEHDRAQRYEKYVSDLEKYAQHILKCPLQLAHMARTPEEFLTFKCICGLSELLDSLRKERT